MGIYGQYFKPKPVYMEENTIDFDFHSVVYEEYLNRTKLLSECTNDNDRFILEAQTEVLYEISFKDIGEKIKKAIDELIKKVKEIIQKIKDFFAGKKREGMKKKTSELEDELKAAEATIKNMKAQAAKADAKQEVYEDKIKDYEDRINSMVEKMSDNELLYFNVKNYMDPSKKVKIGLYWGRDNEGELKKSLEGIYSIFSSKVLDECIEKTENILYSPGNINSVHLSSLITEDCDPEKNTKPKDIMSLYSELKDIEETDYKDSIQTTLNELEDGLAYLREEVEKGKVSSSHYTDLDGKEKYLRISKQTYNVTRNGNRTDYEPEDILNHSETINNPFEGLSKQIKETMTTYQSAIIAVNIINNQYMKQIGFADSCIRTLSVFSSQVVDKYDNMGLLDRFEHGLDDKNIRVNQFRK